MDNILVLHRDLSDSTYRHGGYHHFRISDPKPRDIHKASVRDRLVHHALYRKLYSFFDRTFVSDSYSCRRGKGTHRAMNRFRQFAYKVSKNHTRTCWILKCDIRKFFASVDQKILLDIVGRYIPEERTNTLMTEIVGSFDSTELGKGLPLGNLTSQLLVNIYMNEFDQFVKHQLKAKYYIRYADDFVILSSSRSDLEEMLRYIRQYLADSLRLELHPDKVFIKTLASGVDFLGWVHFPDHRVLQTSTKRRMYRNCRGQVEDASVTISYFGLLKHGNAFWLRNGLSASFNT
jgi:RNA-directed DNA polymerase